MTKRAILITGCSSGIGQHCARGMRSRGWEVFATARKSEDLDSLRREGLRAHYLDYTEPQSIADLADNVLSQTDGKLAALFNNGGQAQPGAVEDITPEVLRAQFDVNFFGWHDLTRRIVPAMLANGGGRIVQCSSILGFASLPYRGAYNASKFAVEALSDALRYELWGQGVYVSLIEPGPIETKLVAKAIDAMKKNIDIEGSRHRDYYMQRLEFFERGGEQRFKLGPEAVLTKLVHAVESRNPKPRYYVTAQTYFAAYCKRLLPHRVVDAIFAKQF